MIFSDLSLHSLPDWGILEQNGQSHHIYNSLGHLGNKDKMKLSATVSNIFLNSSGNIKYHRISNVM